MNNVEIDKETNSNKKKTLVTSIKEFKVPWKDFLSPNLYVLGIWIFFLLYSFLWSPVDIAGFGFGNFALVDVGPIAWSLFNLVGAMALLYAATLLLENRERFVPAWIFVLGSAALGMYFLMPYFAFRGVWKKKPKTKETLFAKIVDSRTLGIIIALLASGLLFYGIIAGSIIGDWSNFGNLLKESNFVNIMTVDFALLCLFYPITIWDDMKRRNWANAKLFVLFCIPLIGGLIYLAARPRLQFERSSKS